MKKHYHLIGIGGIGMSGIAHLLLKSGFMVSGSDLRENRSTEELKRSGARIFIGHSVGNICDQDVVVYSSAIKDDNPELKQAKIMGKTLIKRAEALVFLMKDKEVITVSGSHGKTTTTSLVSYMLLEAGFNPTVAIGGILNNIDANARLGSGEFFVAEADESDGSFLNYTPKYSIITNIDHEHLDYYHSFENELVAFKEFMERTRKDGCIFACYDDPVLLKLVNLYCARKVTFGLDGCADICAKNISFIKGQSAERFTKLSSDFDCYFKNKFLSHFHLSLGGRHNISNSLAVIGLGLDLGIDLKQISRSLSEYKGAGRRLETKFKNNKYLVMDDYGHHPSEIKATLAAVSNLAAKRRIVVFQPHRYSRTKLLLDDFAKSFSQADYLILTDIYAASESPIEGVSVQVLLNKIKENLPGKEVVYLAKENILKHILDLLCDGDLVITLGAGDIVKVSDELAKELD
ncbi:MAG: UDP-N-acetylmuramate--L-alanine ligase [Candidatus Omnitrophica bacterium]|nr:UDP-N-acetylmuramate--L-alanine ligase [Candidatus Omnitrophota bacterium]